MGLHSRNCINQERELHMSKVMTRMVKARVSCAESPGFEASSLSFLDDAYMSTQQDVGTCSFNNINNNDNKS